MPFSLDIRGLNKSLIVAYARDLKEKKVDTMAKNMTCSAFACENRTSRTCGKRKDETRT